MAYVVGLGCVQVILSLITGVFGPLAGRSLQGGVLAEDRLVIGLLLVGRVLEYLFVFATVVCVDFLKGLWNA